jgi:flagellar biosynthesis protein FlhG
MEKKMDQAANLRKMLESESGKVCRLNRFREHMPHSGSSSPTVLSITSGKGGVGKTNVAGNLAIACQRLGKRVLIFDADLGLANIDIIFGLNPKYTIEDVINGEKELSQIIFEGPEGVAVIPASSGIQELANLSEGHKVNLLNEFDVLNSMFDILLIDTGAGISSNVIYFNLAVQERIIVVTPEPTSITDAYALIKVMFNQYGTKSFYLLMNMVKDEDEAKRVYKHLSGVVGRFMESVSVNYAGFVPWDAFLQEAVTRREPITCCYPEASSSRRFEIIARFLLSQPSGISNDGNIKFFWKRLMAGPSDLRYEGRN